MRAAAGYHLFTTLFVLSTTTNLAHGQGCTNTCPPINFGVAVPALCEGDRLDDASLPTTAGIDRIYDVCHPTIDPIVQSFSLSDFKGKAATVIANFYTGCNAGRRESGIFAHVAQKYYDLYQDKVMFVQSLKGGGTCQQWADMYQDDATNLFADTLVVPKEMPLSVQDVDYALRDDLFTTPFGHPSYVVLDANLTIRHKFIGPCCGYESYFDCTTDIAKSLDVQLSGYLDALLSETTMQGGDGEDGTATTPAPAPTSGTAAGTTCIPQEFSAWSDCSIRCGPTEGIQFRWRQETCGGTAGPPLETRPCTAATPTCEEDIPTCVPVVGASYTIETIVDGLNSPRDVAFHPQPGYHLGEYSEGRSFDTTQGEEAWIINGNNHTMTIVASLGTDAQTTLARRDRGYFHYMINGTALSFNMVGDSGRAPDRDSYRYWAICNDNVNTYLGTKEANYFMGPTLYDSNPQKGNLVNRLGQECQPEEEPCSFLHVDMLHESPACIGIAHDPETVTAYGTVYWAFDATGNRETGQLVRFDFQQPHGPGSMDHSIASVRRYVEVELERGPPGVHAGMAVHANRRELFVAVPGANKVLRVDADSGVFARTAREEYPIYSNQLPSFEYSIWECVQNVDFITGISTPSGLALSNDGEQLFVAERDTGIIHVYEVASGARLFGIETGFNSIGGMSFSPVGGILYFVDQNTNTLNAVQPTAACQNPYATRLSSAFASEVEAAKLAIGNSFSLSVNAYNCTADPTIPDAAYFDQVHEDSGYASDNPDVQSEMAGMDASAALLANRTDCGVFSELNLDSLLLGGYFCHVCLPEQDQTCDKGGTCTNVQWQGYVCDNEYYIVANNDSGLTGPRYLLTTANGTVVESVEMKKKPNMQYRFTVTVDEEVCMSLSIPSRSREEYSILQTEQRNGYRRLNSVVLGCAARGPIVVDTGASDFAGNDLFVNVLGDQVFQVSLEQVSAGSLATAFIGVAVSFLVPLMMLAQ